MFRTAAPIPPPFPNPEYKPGKKGLPKGGPDKPGFSEGGQHGHHWYHGTTHSPEEDDPDNHPDSRDSGGRLRPPEVDEHSGSNERKGVHWNTDLGVHFTSLSAVARGFGDKRDIDSRMAHATLHMANPKHYPDEVAFGRHAIDWAHANGHRMLSSDRADHEDFVHGEYRALTKRDTEGRDYGHLAMESLGRSERRDMVDLDRKGTKSPLAHELHPVDQYLALHPKRHQITHGFREHLESQGHDGVVYGNSYEGPDGHTSAIAFPSTPIGIHKWEWHHPDSQDMPKTPQEARERRQRGELPDEDQMKLFGALVTASEAERLTYDHEEQETGGSKRPMKITLRARHPEDGEVGTLKYLVPRRKADGILIDRLEVDGQHRGKGYGSALMDELQRRHPKTPIDHGDRTDDGKAWWAGYTRDKKVTKGRTIATVRTASGWTSEHFNLEGKHWRGFGGPSEDPRKHMVHYSVPEPGKVTFPDRNGVGTDIDRIRAKHGDDDADRMRGQVLDHHGATEHDPSSEPPPSPEKPKRRTYYHGTTVPDVTHILPANHHGKGVVFHSVTDKDYAYASEDPKDAWNYAEKAYDTLGNGPKGDRHPRVYQVRPVGGHEHVEKDPEWDHVRGISRGNNESDRRSKKGWEVVREMKMPKHMGKPEDWHKGGERA
jgi:GNAT superfamily N-acetyltransferase